MDPRQYEHQAGQSLVLIALLMVGIAGMLGLALDGSRVFGARRQSQNAADAAAIAAVRVLAASRSTTSESAIYNTAVNLAHSNGVTTSTDVIATFINASSADICIINQNCGGIPPAATGVRITTTLRLEPFFINLLIGNQPIPVPAVAAAQSGTPKVATNLMPMIVKPLCADLRNPSCNFQYDVVVRIFGDTQAGGSFQWVDYNQDFCHVQDYLRLEPSCVSGPILADPGDTYYNPSHPTDWNLDPPPPPSPSPWIHNNTGEAIAQIGPALDCWVQPTAHGCWPSPTQYPGDNKWITPVYDYTNGIIGGDTLRYHTIMFAEFEFLGYWFANNQCNWVGKLSTQNCNNVLSPDLQPCADTNTKCLIGKFKREVTNLRLLAGPCNTNGLDICSIGMSQ